MKVCEIPEKLCRCIILLALALVVPRASFAAIHCVRAGATGNGGGSDWTNACPDFRGACSPGSLVRGDTYYIAAGNYGSANFSTTDLGTALITVKVATTADHGTDTGWQGSFAVTGSSQAIFAAPLQFSTDHWVLDGTITASANSMGCGPSGCGLRVNNPCTNANCAGTQALGFTSSSVSDITVRYLEYAGAGSGGVGLDINVGETRSIAGASCNGARNQVMLTTNVAHRFLANQFISTSSISLAGFTNGTHQITSNSPPGNTALVIQASCTPNATGAGGHISATWDNEEEGPRWITCSNITLSHNYLHDVVGIPIVLSSCNTVIVDHNYVTRTVNNTSAHAQGLQDGGSSNITVSNNLFLDIDGVGCVVELSGGGGNIANNWNVYGNICAYSQGNPYKRGGLANGAFCCINTQTCSNWTVVNNSVVNIQTTYGFSDNPNPVDGRVFFQSTTNTTKAIVENNIFFGSNNVDSTTGTNITQDYNYYSQNTGNSIPAEAHSQVTSANPFVNWTAGDYHLLRPTDAGISLASPFSIDADGTIRGGAGLWSRGAYEFSSTATVRPAPPTNLRIIP